MTETEKHSKTKLQQVTFWPIPEVTDAEMIFGAGVGRYLSRYNRPEVPHKFVTAAEELFLYGVVKSDLGVEFPSHIDPEKMKRLVRALMVSFALAHEAKITTIAYAFWVWSTPGLCPPIPTETEQPTETTP